MLLLALPSSVFDAVVPVLILLAVALMAFKPTPSAEHAPAREHTAAATGGTFLTGIYGGYFGAAQGVILLALTGIAIPEDLQRLNALKNVLAALVNGVAAVIFIFFASVAWLPAVLLAVGSAAGGQLGAKVGRRLSPAVLRGLIVVVGIAAIVQLLT